MYHVFSDESGQSGRDYEDKVQPVLCQTAVIIEEQNIQFVETESAELLEDFGLPRDQEIHAYECIQGIGPFGKLDKTQRNDLLKRFVEIGVKHCYLFHYMGMLKPFVKDFVRKNAEKSGLDPFMISFLYLILIIDKYFEYILGERYRYYFDTTDNYRKKIRKSVEQLKEIPQESLKINCMIGPPEEKDSEDSRLIQLSDVVGYYMTRHRQLEIGTFKHREGLNKHSGKIKEIHALIKPKLLNYIRNEIPQRIDWNALQKFDFINL